MGHNHFNSEHSHSNESHSHSHSKNKKALALSFFLIFTFMFVEFIGGFLTNSLALLSDAGHMLSDAAALGISLGAIIFGERVATKEKTFGYKRFEILAALTNGVILLVIAIFISIEAIKRFSHPAEVQGAGMMIISFIGLVINIIVAWILSRGGSKDNLNVRSALLHVMGDLLGSVGAIIAATLILLFGWDIADPIASIVVSLLILYSGWNIVKESIHILMEGKPSYVDTKELISIVEKIEGVETIHDLHIWMITSDFPTLTAHINVTDGIDRDILLENIINIIIKETGISHITIQLEGRELNTTDKPCCN